MTSFQTFDHDNLSQVSVCRQLRPNRDLTVMLIGTVNELKANDNYFRDGGA